MATLVTCQAVPSPSLRNVIIIRDQLETTTESKAEAGDTQ